MRGVNKHGKSEWIVQGLLTSSVTPSASRRTAMSPSHAPTGQAQRNMRPARAHTHTQDTLNHRLTTLRVARDPDSGRGKAEVA